MTFPSSLGSTALPARSNATLHARMEARLASRPSKIGPEMPLPAGVVSQSVRGLIFRRARPSPTYTEPAENVTPQGPNRASPLPLAGPPTPPATVVITAAATWPRTAAGCGAACAWPVLIATAGASPAVAARTASRPAGRDRQQLRAI